MAASSTSRRNSPSPLLTISEVIAELRIPRATFYRWRQLRKGPRSIRLPNGASGSAAPSWSAGSRAWKTTPARERDKAYQRRPESRRAAGHARDLPGRTQTLEDREGQ
jgi:predicted DNA-binding transcriptional regulator AlpA